MALSIRFKIDEACRNKISELKNQMAAQTSLILDPNVSEAKRLDAYEKRFELRDEIKKLQGWMSRPSTANLTELGL